MAESTAPRESLPDILKIEERGSGECRASLEGFWGETDAGDLLARATLAASARGREDPVASQAVFLAQAPPDVPLSFAREPLGAERRRVRVTHGKDLLSEITFRFCEPCSGLTYQSIAPAADLPRRRTFRARSSSPRPRAGRSTRSVPSSRVASASSLRLPTASLRCGSAGCSRERRCPTTRTCTRPRSPS